MEPDDAESTNERAVRLGREVRRRLAELGVSGRTVADAGYIPRGNLQRLTSGRSVPRDLTGLERGLGWLTGSADLVAAGGQPKTVLVPRGQTPERPGQAVIDWPRSDEDWHAAVENAWKRADGLTTEESPADQLRDQNIDEWLAPRVEGLPVWLAERIRTVLTEASRDTSKKADPLALADRIMPLDHARTVLALLIEWCRGRL